LFLSDDSGAHWSTLPAGLPTLDVQQILMDPFDASTLYASTGSEGGLFVLTRSSSH
jgi:hypothetical protein